MRDWRLKFISVGCFFGFAAGRFLGQGTDPVSTETAANPRVISADAKESKGPRSTVYRRCVGAGRVGEGLRADWQEQLRECQQAIGFEYLRCHGLLHDELGVYSENAKGEPVYNWQYIDMVYDFLLSIHVRPFVEVGFMPEALASLKQDGTTVPGVSSHDRAQPDKKRNVSVFWWKSNISPPKDWNRWDGLITALTQHWTERYGAAEVKQWYFEIWNEPNHPGFFSPVDSTKRRDEYFELYTHTAKDIRSINPEYRVGGPAGAGPAWMKEFIEYCATNQVPLDFITFHSYGLSGGPSGLDVEGRQYLYVSRAMNQVARTAHSQDDLIRKSPLPNLPVHITEWSASYSNHDPVHDSYFEAPYILDQLKNTETLGSMSYWTFSDIFEESGPPKKPFEGGFGLINLQGIKKAAFFAYSFLNQLGENELKNADHQSWVCTDPQGGVQALWWDLTDARPAKPVSDQVYFGQIEIPKDKPPVKLHLTSLKPGSYHLSISHIGFQQNDPYSAYLNMGAPSQLTRAQVDQLKQQATGAPDQEKDITVGANGTWEADFPMRENEVVFAKLTPRALKSVGSD